MQMSISKTKYLHYGTAQHSGEPLHIAQQEIEQVSKFKYLGSMQTSDLSARAEVSNRLTSVANAWQELCNPRYCMQVRHGLCPSSNCTGWRFFK